MPSAPYSKWICPICKKEFTVYYVKMYAFKQSFRGENYIFCSRTCKTKFKEKVAGLPKRRRKTNIECANVRAFEGGEIDGNTE